MRRASLLARGHPERSAGFLTASMFPVLSIFGVSLQPLLLACGVLAAIATAERLAVNIRVAPQRIATAAILGLLSIFLGERLILFARNWRELVAHPLWMVGLISVRDPRLFYAGAAIALLVCAVYLLATRIALRRAAGALVPAALLLLAFVHAGYFAAGAEPGRVTSAHWGVVYTSWVAHALYGTPLYTRLFPVAPILAVGYALLALAGAIAAIRRRESTGFLLLGAGLLTVLVPQFALRWTGEPMLLGVFTWVQAAGVLTTVAGSLLLLAER